MSEIRIANPSLRPCFFSWLISAQRSPRCSSPRESYRTSPGLTTYRVARALARMMKQILLRVAPMFAEIAVAKFAELERGDFSLSRKILLLEHSLDPDIDRKCAEPFVSKEHHAVRDLCPDARQLAKPRAQLRIRQLAPCFEVRFATRHESRGG